MIGFRKAVAADVDELLRLEALAFKGDRLSRSSFRRWLRHATCIFVVAEQDGVLCGYILVTLRRGSGLARLYSLAVDPEHRRRGIGARLIELGERGALDAGAMSMRLEVAVNHEQAIGLYRKLGYLPFGLLQSYYEDRSDAVRMEKCINRLQR